jgi:hypothetical protein
MHQFVVNVLCRGEEILERVIFANSFDDAKIITLNSISIFDLPACEIKITKVPFNEESLCKIEYSALGVTYG